jgi:divalent metal cation (Fe/Co/Zn/Cd) transporter
LQVSDYFAGYGKFESLGTVTVSVLLILGGFGVGLHSYGALLTESIGPLLPTLSPDSLTYSILSFLVSSAPSPEDHDQSDTAAGLSPIALFFPVLSIIVKEWLYRLMSGIAKETGSSVLLANALHHRSDAWGSLVSLLAIFGGIFLPGYGVDPLGGASDTTIFCMQSALDFLLTWWQSSGIFVGIMILISGVNIFGGAIGELTDASISDSTLNAYSMILDGQSTHLAPALVNIQHIRGVRSGGTVFVDVVVKVAPIATAKDIVGIARRLEETLRGARKEVREVRVKVELQGP